MGGEKKNKTTFEAVALSLCKVFSDVSVCEWPWDVPISSFYFVIFRTLKLSCLPWISAPFHPALWLWVNFLCACFSWLGSEPCTQAHGSSPFCRNVISVVCWKFQTDSESTRSDSPPNCALCEVACRAAEVDPTAMEKQCSRRKEFQTSLCVFLVMAVGTLQGWGAVMTA